MSLPFEDIVNAAVDIPHNDAGFVPDNADVSLSKKVDGPGAETNKDFAFKLELINQDYDLPEKLHYVRYTEGAQAGKGDQKTDEGDVNLLGTVSDRYYGFKIKDNEKIVFQNIPVRSQYIFTETSGAENYNVAKTGDSGYITRNTNAAEFTNTHKESALYMEKRIDGSLAQKTDEFQYTVTLTYNNAPYALQKVNYMKNGTDMGYLTTDSNGQVKIMMHGGDNAKISYLPSTAKYKVEETHLGYQSKPITDKDFANEGVLIADKTAYAGYVNIKDKTEVDKTVNKVSRNAGEGVR